jgi:hypothetical protein
MKIWARRIVMPAAGVLAAAGLSIGVAQASIPDHSGIFHACYKKGGRLRVIDTSSQGCRRNETAVSWPSTPGAGLTGWQLIQCVWSSESGQVAVSGSPLCSATGPTQVTITCPPGKLAVQEAGSLLSFEGQGYASVNPDGSGAVFRNPGNDGTFSIQLACASGSS